MLSREIEERLVEIFITISIGEEKLNKLKQNIFSNFNINPMLLFVDLDLDKDGYLTKNDFYSFLNFFSINFISTDIDYIFFFYDKDEDNYLNFIEFLDLLISDSNYFFKKSIKKQFKNRGFDTRTINEECEFDIEKAFLDLLLEEIDLGRQLNELIINIKECNDFTIQDVFYELKSYNYITNDSLKAFFDRNEVNYNDKFIKNIFCRFKNKDINGKIVFKTVKKFFDLPVDKNINRNEQLYINNFQPKLSQTLSYGDIKFNQLNKFNNYMDSNSDVFNYRSPYEKNNYNENICDKFKRDLYVNEEDIQFKCSHLSRSGSFESYDLQNSNCKLISKNEKKNTLYKNYLREKRSKSLEKSLNKSRINIRNIKPIQTNNNNIHYIKDTYYNNNSESSFHEDLPVNMPIRLDKNLVKRKIPTRNKIQNVDKIMTYNFCYGNNIEDIKINHHNYKQINKHYSKQNNFTNFNNSKDIYYNGCNDFKEYNTNYLDNKLYQEDINIHNYNKKYY